MSVNIIFIIIVFKYVFTGNIFCFSLFMDHYFVKFINDSWFFETLTVLFILYMV